jgi:hypothetical protein
MASDYGTDSCGIFAIDRPIWLWQPRRYTPIWGLLVVRRIMTAPGNPYFPDSMMKALEEGEKTLEAARDARTSKGAFEKLVEQVQEFESGLKSDEDVAVYLASFGASMLMTVEKISFEYPLLIIFEGVLDTGQPGKVVQHFSQLSFILTTVRREDSSSPRKKIGFV